jgi:lipopolysaccharide export system permease protein
MIIYRYILKNHAAPFIFANITLIAVFLLQFLMKFADKLVGKGLSTWVIIQLIAYNLAWMVVLVVPMAVLIATLMAFGSMAQNNEVAIFKASGLSLYKMMIPPLLGSIIIAYLLVLFNNHVYPNANHAARVLGNDISRKKPTLSLVPGIFSQEVQNYAILSREIDPKTNELSNVTIYDYSNPSKINIVSAKKGKIYFTADQKKLMLDLTDGEIHESEVVNFIPYRKLKFNRHKIAMDASQFSFQQSTNDLSRGEREMGAAEMLVIVDSLKLIENRFFEELNERINRAFKNDSIYAYNKVKFNTINLKGIYFRVEDRIKSVQSSITVNTRQIDYNKINMNAFLVEIHKKYSIPFACIVFILIGAPLGTMLRKGGFGVAAGVSLVFFLIYWAFLIGGEKLADRNLLSPFWGMWAANFVLGGFGLFITYKAAKERIELRFDFITKLIPKAWKQQVADENT